MHNADGMAAQRTDFQSLLASHREWEELPEEVRRRMGRHFSSRKAVRFGEQWVVDSLIPPFPSKAFSRFVERKDVAEGQSVFSVSLAVTNRCWCNCWHCYNAERSQEDLPLRVLRELARQLQDLGAVLIALTGGEPLIRRDLKDVCRAFDDRCCVVVNTTGIGLTLARARAMKEAGVFAVSISLDSDREADHDAFRRRPGAFRQAVKAVGMARKAGLYPYVMTMARRELVDPRRFFPFMEFAGAIGAMEVRFLDPIPVARLRGRRDALLLWPHRRRMLENAKEVDRRDDLPIFSTSACQGQSLGCPAGQRHIYIDGNGELCPCNYIPCSFGNVGNVRSAHRTTLKEGLARMRLFRGPRAKCAALTLAPHIPDGPLPIDPDKSDRLCEDYLKPDGPGRYIPRR